MSNGDEVNRPGYGLVLGYVELASGWNVLVMNQQQQRKPSSKYGPFSISLLRLFLHSSLLEIFKLGWMTTFSGYYTSFSTSLSVLEQFHL